MHEDALDFNLLDHTADMGIVVRAPDREALFRDAARVMLQLLWKGPGPSPASRRMRLTVEGDDWEDLMVRWLSEILYLLEGEHRVVTVVEVRTPVPYRLEALMKWASFDPHRHEIVNEIKAVTYHQIAVRQKPTCWEARIVFDL